MPGPVCRYQRDAIKTDLIPPSTAPPGRPIPRLIIERPGGVSRPQPMVAHYFPLTDLKGGESDTVAISRQGPAKHPELSDVFKSSRQAV
jgi:hypothetical protein